MELYVSKEYYGDGVSITFPATKAYVLDQLATLGVYDIDDGQPVFIRGDGLINHFAEFLRPADLGTEIGIQKLNQLSKVMDTMSEEEQNVCAGALRAEHITNGLNDVLRIAGSLDSYELFPSIKTDEELGHFLVDTGPITGKVVFSEEVKPYLDYAKIGAEQRERLDGVYCKW